MAERKQGNSSTSHTPVVVNSDEEASGSKKGGRPRRHRTVFTREQMNAMERRFAHQIYMVGDERRQFAHSIGLNEFQVKIWWQNRRIKMRRAEHELKMASVTPSTPHYKL